MTSSHPAAVPTDVADVRSFAENFRARYGVAPIAGGEHMVGAPPPAPAAPAAPDPAAPSPAPAPDPAAAAPAPGQPAAPEAAPGVPMTEATAQQLLARFDEIGPAAPPDPIGVELGLMQPAPAMPGQPQGQPGAVPLPGQQGAPQVPVPPQQQPGAQLPVGSPEEQAAIDRYVETRARQVAEAMFEEQISPKFARMEADRRRGETESLVADHPELQDRGTAEQLLSRARNWATQLGTPELAREPGFLELTLLAGKQMAAAQAAGAQVPVVPTPGNGEVPIEQPGPAAPAGAAAGIQDPGQRIVEAGKGHGLSSVFG